MGKWSKEGKSGILCCHRNSYIFAWFHGGRRLSPKFYQHHSGIGAILSIEGLGKPDTPVCVRKQ